MSQKIKFDSKIKELTLLYVEDDSDVAEIMTIMLKKIFGKVYAAKDGMEALNIYQNNKIDITVSDIMMPKMDGLELSKEILKINANAKIILVTADNEVYYKNKSIELGIQSYLRKPISFKNLIEEISKFQFSGLVKS